jgi:RNA polymerase sigma-70 factor (ECF subfamily)
MSILEFNNQVQQLSESLYSFAYNLTRNIEDAKDLIQETAYRALLNREKFKMNSNLKAWLYTIMKNIFINNYRKESKQRTILADSENNFYESSLNATTSNSAEAKLGLACIEKELASIDPNLRTPFIRYFEGYKYHEIADELNLPLGTVKSRIFFARREMQRRVRRY